MYAHYKKSQHAERYDFKFVEECSLFGCNEGFIPWLLGKQISLSQDEPFKWHIPIQSSLNSAGAEYRDSALIIDLKPKQQKMNLSLYEVLDVWGYSDSGWSPILLHLGALFVDAGPKTVDRESFSIPKKEPEEPIYEFLYLNGSVSNGKLTGPWTAPPASPTNGALLWPKTLKYFVGCIRQRTPLVFD